MTAYLDEEEFLLDMLSGSHVGFSFQTDLDFYSCEKYLDEIAHLENVSCRFKKQLLDIVKTCRDWKVRHISLTDKIEKRYSRYEGTLCYQDLRRHWFLYRYVRRELFQKRGEYQRSLDLAYFRKNKKTVGFKEGKRVNS